MPRTETTPALPRARKPSRCVYCGWPLTPDQANKWPGTCGSHADLPARDPSYMLALRSGRR